MPVSGNRALSGGVIFARCGGCIGEGRGRLEVVSGVMRLLSPCPSRH
jgi:hypothetical protein